MKSHFDDTLSSYRQRGLSWLDWKDAQNTIWLDGRLLARASIVVVWDLKSMYPLSVVVTPRSNARWYSNENRGGQTLPTIAWDFVTYHNEYRATIG
jgi:hypothetical protein